MKLTCACGSMHKHNKRIVIKMSATDTVGVAFSSFHTTTKKLDSSKKFLGVELLA